MNSGGSLNIKRFFTVKNLPSENKEGHGDIMTPDVPFQRGWIQRWIYLCLGSWNCQSRDLPTEKDVIINILGFENHIVSVTTTQFRYYGAKAVTGNI